MRVVADTAMPRVFDDGPFRLQMKLRRLEPVEWLLVSEHYASELALKRRLLESGADVTGLEPEALPAVWEGLALIERFLEGHHPELAPAADADDPLLRAGLSVQEDLCWLAPGPDGYRLVAAFVAFPSRWRLADKMGRPLQAIHAPVPELEARIGAVIGRFFDALHPARPVWRANWSLMDDPALHQPVSAEARSLDARDAGQELFVRVERQTFRRLPRTGLVLFTIHTFVRPLAAVAARPESARALVDRLEEMPPAMLAYKNLQVLGPIARAYLEQRAAA